MKFAIRTLAATAALACFVPAASAEVLNFDDLTGTVGFTTPYHGFTFTYNQGPRTAPCDYCLGSWYWSDDNIDKDYYKTPSTSLSTDFQDDTFTPVYGDSQAILAAAPVIFDGAWFTALDDAIDITFKLYRSGALVGTSTMQLDYADPSTYLASGYTGLVDKIVVEGYQGYFAMDDFTFQAVPEPSTYALILAALGGMGLVARRRKNQA